MSKVRIVLEAEIGDLPVFWPNDPKGVTKQNVSDLLRGAIHSAREKLVRLEWRHASRRRQHSCSTSVYTSTKKILRQEVELAERLMASIQVEVL